jgi:hypothetical protein
MAKSDHVWVTLTNVHVRSADTFAEEAGFWDRVFLNFEPGNSAEWDLVASGGLTWDGRYDVRGDDEDDLEGGKHAVPPLNPVIEVHWTREVDLSTVNPPQLRVSGTERDTSGDDAIHEIVIDLAPISSGGRWTGSTNSAGFHYLARVVVQPSLVGSLTSAPDLDGGSRTTDDPAIAFTTRYYPQTREREPVAQGDGGHVEGVVVWNHAGPKVAAADQQVRVFDLQHRELTTYEAALGGLGACNAAGRLDPALYAYRPRSRPDLIAILRDGDPAPIHVRLPETRIADHPLPSRPAIARSGDEIAIAFADPAAERLRVYRLRSYDELAASVDPFGVVTDPFVDAWEQTDTTQVAPAVAYVGDVLWVAWASGADQGTPGVVRVREVNGAVDRVVEQAGAPATSLCAPALSVFENQRVTVAWTQPSGLVSLQDVIGPSPEFATTVTPLAGSAPSLALDEGRLYVAYAIADAPSFLHYEQVTVFNRTGSSGSGSMTTSGGH